LQRGVEIGDVAPDTNVAELASFFGTVFRGMAVQARDGKSRNHLRGLARVAMRVWHAARNQTDYQLTIFVLIWTKVCSKP
jgi:hypothetical protein